MLAIIVIPQYKENERVYACRLSTDWYVPLSYTIDNRTAILSSLRNILCPFRSAISHLALIPWFDAFWEMCHFTDEDGRPRLVSSLWHREAQLKMRAKIFLSCSVRFFTNVFATAPSPPPLTSTYVPNPIMGIFAPVDSEIFVFSNSIAKQEKTGKDAVRSEYSRLAHTGMCSLCTLFSKHAQLFRLKFVPNDKATEGKTSSGYSSNL